MKIVVIGGNGLIGTKVVRNLRALGHETIAASRDSGIDLLTGQGLAQTLEGAHTVIDLSNSPSFEDAAVLAFFETGARNLLPAEAGAGVAHHVALSIVGVDGIPDSGYMRAKVAQEKAITASTVPYTIVRATQFFEFIGGIADAYTEGNTVRLSHAMMQPIAAEDVAEAVTRIALEQPSNGTLDLAGPEPIRMDELARRLLAAKHDPRTVETNPDAGYFGAKVTDHSLVPAGEALIGATHFQDWLNR
jgi:uncharacterized protein YbjT (DUF2867 family)